MAWVCVVVLGWSLQQLLSAVNLIAFPQLPLQHLCPAIVTLTTAVGTRSLRPGIVAWPHMALKDAAYQEALLTKRIEFVQRLKADLSVTNSIAAQTVAAYTELVDGEPEQ